MCIAFVFLIKATGYWRSRAVVVVVALCEAIKLTENLNEQMANKLWGNLDFTDNLIQLEF